MTSTLTLSLRARDGFAASEIPSQFCDAYPKSTLHFLTRKELLDIKSIVNVIKISSTSSTSCQTIKGLT
jgi:hypothetical protein